MVTVKEKILAAAAIMIEERGISFRMDDLAKSLTISKRTLYEQFHSKHEIVETILVHGAEEFYRQHENIVKNKNLTLEEVLDQYFKVRSNLYAAFNGESFIEIFLAIPQLQETLKSLFKKDWDLLKDYLVRQQEQGYIAQYVDIDIIIMMLQGAVRNIVFESSSHHEDVYTYMPKVISVILQGIINKGETNEKTSL
ncbi:TetR/AcrR family transcriptional regulator [Veillonella sp. CHU740]|uniref:TetR/AcrR family transcriptional regulator n=1 Tax=Veillonella sp. CHU740 TaxID=2490950 RepID=UPI000F8C9602|nr:TetR/AcrR family transcriptional regulator [Veillonella sp. CHU740]